MPFTDEEKRLLAARAQSIDARIARNPADPSPNDGAEIKDVIETWKENVADGDDEAFRRRLAIDDLSEDDLPALLAPEEDAIDSLPSWVEVVEELQTHLERDIDGRLGGIGDGDPDEEPFEHVLSPIVEFAVERLDVATSSPRIQRSAVRSGAEILEERLRRLYLHPLFIEFKTALTEGTAGNEGDASSRSGYRAFVRDALETGLREFFLEYAVLARWTVVVIEQWVSAFEEFARRLERDWETLEETFGAGEPLGDVVCVESFGDLHHGGRQVFGVTTASDVTFAYKPRNLSVEAKYYEFLSWLNAESQLPDLRIVDCVAREDYGWMEWIESTECSSTDEVHRYFERTGILICVLYVLRFVDGNLENIIAEGDQPVVLDLEGLLQPDLPESLMFGEKSLVDIIRDSVLWTGIPPMELFDPDVQDINGIDQPNGKQQEVASRSVTDANTDAMELEFEEESVIEGESLPRYDGETASPYEHAEVLINGFRNAYKFFCRERDRVLEKSSVFEDAEVRIICRNTSAYGKVQRPLVTSSWLRSGLKCDVRVELLTNWIEFDDLDEEMWELYEAERVAMWRLDIPRFAVNSSETDLFLEDRTLDSYLETPPTELVRQRVRSMDQRDLSRQVDYLTTAYDRDELLNPTPPTDGFDADEIPDWESVAKRRGDEIFERLRDAATRNADGDLVWYHRINTGDGVSVHSLRDDIYDGRLGVGVFAGALAKHFERNEYRRLVAEVTDPMLDTLETDEDRFADKKLGAAHGLGSLVYGFTKLGEWLDEPRYTEAAKEASTYITEQRLANDDVLDLIGGVAGAALGLLALYDETGDERALERAKVAGNVLLENRVDIDGVSTWPTYDGPQKALIGPGHGVSGIAYALYRLGDVTAREQFKSAALEGLRFEEQHYSSEENNWPDFRFDRCRPGWCAGRAGVGLSRLGMLEIDDREVLRRDLRRVLGGIDPEQLSTEDQICCGNFSRVEFLVRASRTLGEDRYRRWAEELAADVLHRAEKRDGFSIPWQTEHWYSKSLYLGEPGIGVSLLRLAGADLPCFLLWD